VANRKSVAWHVVRSLEAEGARVVLSVHSEKRVGEVRKLAPQLPVFVCDFEREGDCDALAAAVGPQFGPIHGIVHSVAYANYSEGFKPFHETRRSDFLQATTISAFSLVELARAFKPHLAADASVVTMGISSLLVTAENYGYMSPIKASLEGIVRNLAKSFSADTGVRFNAVGAGPLKTSSSSGIPGYVESYLYAEKLTFRRRNLETQEVADTALFLLSPRSSGINGSTMVVDAGLGMNYFDKEVVRLAMRADTKS
jgi:enoyl-[acyl-carrier protein] reductase I